MERADLMHNSKWCLAARGSGVGLIVALGAAVIATTHVWAQTAVTPPTTPNVEAPSVPTAPAAVDTPAATPPVVVAPPATPKDLLARAKSWGYQLNSFEVARLVASPFDVLVLDYSRDGTETAALKPADIELLKKKPDGSRRVLLSYFSIGEAEDYRYYWNKGWSNWYFIPNFWSKPSWLGKQNGDWGGNYAVRYWEPEWQKILLGDGQYLDRIVGAGFDGVWLDKVDSSLEDVASANPRAREDMIGLIGKIGERGRAARPGFLVVPQNGEDLLADPKLLPMIDGFGKESLIYGEDGPQKPNAPEFVARKTELLKTVTAAGKAVLAVEYLDSAEAAAKASQQIATAGFVPLNATRALDVFPGDKAGGSTTERGRLDGVGLIGSSWTWLLIGVGLLALMLLGTKLNRKRL
jgi:cysteinyl-tRNA synthetase, unknown class